MGSRSPGSSSQPTLAQVRHDARDPQRLGAVAVVDHRVLRPRAATPMSRAVSIWIDGRSGARAGATPAA
jgi:hypothetical protein